MSSAILISFFIFILIIIISGGVLYFTTFKDSLEIRSTPAVSDLEKSLGLSIEDGRGIHISLGKSDLQNFHGAASILGLETLNQVIEQSVLSDKPPVTTAGNGDITLLAQSQLQSIASETDASQDISSYAYLSGATNLSYIMGTIPPISDPTNSSQVFVGNIGPEIGLLLAASEKNNHYSLTATDSLEGQSVSYAFTEDTLLGEEIFSIPYLLGSNSLINKLALHLHDVLRWVVVCIILLVIFIKFIGII